MPINRIKVPQIILCTAILIFLLFSLKEIGNFYQTGHAGSINAEVGLSHMNTINNGYLKTKLGATDNKIIIDRAPQENEYSIHHPYLHNLFISVLWKITGPSEIAARLFMILIVLISIIVMYFIAKELQFPDLFSSLVFLTLCSFPVYYHYAGLSSGEISALLPLALAFYFYVKILKLGGKKYIIYFLLSLSFACQLFWVGYIATFVFFLDSMKESISRKNKKALTLVESLILTVIINISIYIMHTYWLIGSFKDAFSVFLGRTNIGVSTTQIFSWKEFFINNFQRWWMFNPIAILLALATFFFLFRPKKGNDRLNRRLQFILLLTPLLFSIFFSHLVQLYDFLLIYFSFFIALAAVDFLLRYLKKSKPVWISLYVLILLFFSVSGLIRQPEGKMIDKETNNYELYYTLRVIRQITTPEDRFILAIQRSQEPQVMFYLRRDAFILKVQYWAKLYAESGKLSYYLVENRAQYKSILSYLLYNYRSYKFGRYFLFNLKKPSKRLRIFRRQPEKTGFLYKYFVSPYHEPGKFKENHILKTKNEIFKRFEPIENNSYRE